MKPISVPVRFIGPGSQPDEGDLQCLEFSREMETFAMPSVPDDAPAGPLTQARDVLAYFLQLCEAWDPAKDTHGPKLDLVNVPEDALTIVNQVLGEGEVAIQVSGAQPLRIQESVFTGLWRVCAVDHSGTLVADWLEVAPVPQIALVAAREASGTRMPPVAIPAGAMNSPALLREIEAQLAHRVSGAPAHVLNLTLLPMSPEDHLVLERALPIGPVAMMSRGFGNCRITSTGARDVWRVQYFNSMNTIILNSIEIVDVPEVALAAVEDLVDTRVRLAELIDWMSESIEQ